MQTISRSLKFSASFNGIINKGIHSIIFSSVLDAIKSKLPCIAINLYGSTFSVRPEKNNGRNFFKSTVEGVVVHAIELLAS